MASSLAALAGRILALPFAALSSDSGDSDEAVIVDAAAAAAWFARYLATNDLGDGLDADLWHPGSYKSALALAKQDCLVLCVVLVSKEHDDNAAFLRQSLCTPTFKRFMQEHRGEIMFWGGDVCTSRDAHVAATILQAATFPCLSFLSMQPNAPSRVTGVTQGPSSSTKMTVFSRLEGIDTCAVPNITNHVSETLAPRLNPYLGRLRAQKREREAQRLLREEQDRAYAEAGKRDLERVRAKEAELKARRDAEARQRQEAEVKQREISNRAAWRHRTAPSFGPEASQGTKIVARLPDGRRLMRCFADNETASRIWEWIDCEAAGYSTTAPAGNPPSTSHAAPDPGYSPALSFSLATTFPRRSLKPDQARGKTVGALVSEGLLDKRVASVIVEGLSLSTAQGGDSSSDESEAEED